LTATTIGVHELTPTIQFSNHYSIMMIYLHIYGTVSIFNDLASNNFQIQAPPPERISENLDNYSYSRTYNLIRMIIVETSIRSGFVLGIEGLLGKARARLRRSKRRLRWRRW